MNDSASPSRLFKIKFALKASEGPRAESINATLVSPGRYRLENIPFYARGVSLGDVVEGKEKDGELWFRRRTGRSRNGTIRVYCKGGFQTKPGSEILEGLRKRGFIFEFLGENLAAGCIPVGFDDLKWLESFLDKQTSDVCFYEIPDW